MAFLLAEWGCNFLFLSRNPWTPPHTLSQNHNSQESVCRGKDHYQPTVWSCDVDITRVKNHLYINGYNTVASWPNCVHGARSVQNNKPLFDCGNQTLGSKQIFEFAYINLCDEVNMNFPRRLAWCASKQNKTLETETIQGQNRYDVWIQLTCALLFFCYIYSSHSMVWVASGLQGWQERKVNSFPARKNCNSKETSASANSRFL